MISLIISILVIGIIVGLLLWLVDFIGKRFSVIPAIFINVATVLIVVIAVLWLISILLPFVGINQTPIFKIK